MMYPCIMCLPVFSSTKEQHASLRWPKLRLPSLAPNKVRIGSCLRKKRSKTPTVSGYQFNAHTCILRKPVPKFLFRKWSAQSKASMLYLSYPAKPLHIIKLLQLYVHLTLSEYLGISTSIVESARCEYVEEHTIRPRDGSGQGGNDTKVPPGTRLREKVMQMHQDVPQDSAMALQSWLLSKPTEDETPRRIPVHVNHQTVCNWLHKLGFHRAKRNPAYTLTKERKHRIREYLIEVTKAYNLDTDKRST